MQPLVPVGVDLRGMSFMPLDVNRLRDSQLTIHASGDEFRAAVLLWCASWNQVPAASLPNDDKSLATFAGYARDTKGWKKVREGALRGFILCDDGRLYHPVVAEKALEAWEERVEYREEKTNKDDRKKRERSWRKAAFTALRSIGITPEYNEKTSVLRALVEENGLTKAVIESQHVTPHVTPHVTVTGHTQVTAKTGTGTGTGTGIKDQEQQGGSAHADPPQPDDDESGSRSPHPVPYQAIVQAYHDRLPQLARVRLVTAQRRTAILRAWQSLPIEHRRIGAFRAIFAECAMDDFLNGNGPYSGEHANWRPDFDHLIKLKTLTRVYEKAMDRRERMRQESPAQPTLGAAA